MSEVEDTKYTQTVEEVAEHLGLTPAYIRNFCKKGVLKGEKRLKPGTLLMVWFIDPESVKAYEESRDQETKVYELKLSEKQLEMLTPHLRKIGVAGPKQKYTYSRNLYERRRKRN